MPDAARWCSLCHLPARDARFAPPTDAEVLVSRDQGRPASVSEQARTRRETAAPLSRFAATDITFGLRGRVVMSVLVLLPFWFFVKNLFVGGWIGVVILGAVGLPWAFRDIWRRSDRL